MDTLTKPSTAPAKKAEPPLWERWHSVVTNAGARKVGKAFHNRSFCECCGAFFVLKGGTSNYQKYDGNEYSSTQFYTLDSDDVNKWNVNGVYIGQDQSAEELVKHAGIEKEDFDSFELTDLDGTQFSFAWRNA